MNKHALNPFYLNMKMGEIIFINKIDHPYAYFSSTLIFITRLDPEQISMPIKNSM